MSFVKNQKSDQEAIELQIFDSWEELLEHCIEDHERFMTLITLYKHDAWAGKLQEAVGRLPATSLKQLGHYTKIIERKRAIMHGWWTDETTQFAECAYCGIPVNVSEFTEDHVVPKSQGGSDEIVNLVPCCCDCNELKDDISVCDFLIRCGANETEANQIVESWTSDERKHVPAFITYRMSSNQLKNLGIDGLN